MRIELTKDYAIHAKTLPEGSQLRVSNKLGKELIEIKDNLNLEEIGS